MISYTLPAKANVSIIIYDILGNVVNELFSGEAQQGYNAVVWNSSNASGAKAASGMYLYRITAQLSDGRSFTDVKRMLLLK
jgi:flagellar hook assembly protein FlgD